MITPVIGKYALESLTTGMYSDPLALYREYIQNCADSIDSAFAAGLLTPGAEEICISIDPVGMEINICDNGMGLPCKEAEHTLLNIGSSEKHGNESRGFRGIGRLASISFCSVLEFKTSYVGEDYSSVLTIDAQRFVEIITQPSVSSNLFSAEAVLQEIYSFHTEKAPRDDHYFKVSIRGVAQSSSLLNKEAVISYLSQVAPVPFRTQAFAWAHEISERCSKLGYTIPTYRIYLCTKDSGNTQIFKPYVDLFHADTKNHAEDRLKDIDVRGIYNKERELIAVLWFAHSEFLGTIEEKEMRGLRLRKGNILIGDGQTLCPLFSEGRFNGWTIGEVHVVGHTLLPNARRDNFEKNREYFYFCDKISVPIAELTKSIRSAILNRNSGIKSALEKAEKSADASVLLLSSDNISLQKKASVVSQLNAAKREVASATVAESECESIQSVAFSELDILLGAVEGATSYKAINLASGITKAEKKILEKVFHVLNAELPHEDMDRIASLILGAFSREY